MFEQAVLLPHIKYIIYNILIFKKSEKPVSLFKACNLWGITGLNTFTPPTITTWTIFSCASQQSKLGCPGVLRVWGGTCSNSIPSRVAVDTWTLPVPGFFDSEWDHTISFWIGAQYGGLPGLSIPV